jgi:DNA-binding NarL/FixJ family response regulator
VLALLGNWSRAEDSSISQIGSTSLAKLSSQPGQLLETTVIQLNPTWLIVGTGLDDERASSLTVRIQMTIPKVKLAILGDCADWARCEQWLMRGATVYVRSTIEVGRAIDLLHVAEEAGVMVIDDCFAQSRLARQAQMRSNFMLNPITLTRRERDVLELLRQGMTNSSIGRTLNLQEGTVEYHVGNILSKLGVPNRTQAVVRSGALGI